MNAEDDFDFGAPPSVDVNDMQREISELKVLIDTLQVNLRTAEGVIKQHEPEHSLFNTPSYKWCVNWKPSQY